MREELEKELFESIEDVKEQFDRLHKAELLKEFSNKKLMDIAGKIDQLFIDLSTAFMMRECSTVGETLENLNTTLAELDWDAVTVIGTTLRYTAYSKEVSSELRIEIVNKVARSSRYATDKLNLFVSMWYPKQTGAPVCEELIKAADVDTAYDKLIQLENKMQITTHFVTKKHLEKIV